VSQFWWNTGFVHIFMGGDDVERSILTYNITQIDCPTGATLQSTMELSRNVEVGDILINQQPGVASPLLRFKPAPETWDTYADPTRQYYCKLSYVAIDAQGAVSANPGGVVIHVTYKAKPPRLTTSNGGTNLDVVALEMIPTPFTIPAASPATPPLAFDTYIDACEKNQGTYVFCGSADCSVNSTLDCANIPSGGFKVPTVNNAVKGVFTSGALQNGGQGVRYNRFTLHFDDHTGNFVPTPFFCQFDVIKINQAPTIYVNGDISDSHVLSSTVGQPFTANVTVVDTDAASGFEDVFVTLDNSQTPSVAFDLGAVMSLTSSSGSLRVIDNNHLQIHGQIKQINQILAALSLTSPAASEKVYTATLNMSINDNGFNGQCPDDSSPSPRLCPLSNSTAIVVTWAVKNDNDKVVIASSASAAGFAGLAAIGLIAAFRRFNRKAENQQYSPWEDENMDSVVSNPLYEANQNAGVNPLFQGNN
jgi:hypothetical protein